MSRRIGVLEVAFGLVILMVDGRGDDNHHDHDGRRVRDAAYVA